jgi:hypothetical protein
MQRARERRGAGRTGWAGAQRLAMGRSAGGMGRTVAGHRASRRTPYPPLLGELQGKGRRALPEAAAARGAPRRAGRGGRLRHWGGWGGPAAL